MGEPCRGATVDLSWRVGAGRGNGVSFAVAKAEVGDSGDDLRTLESGVNLARLQGGARNRASCLCQVLFYVLRNFHEPGAVAQSSAGSGTGSLGVAGVLPTPARTYTRHSESGCERN